MKAIGFAVAMHEEAQPFIEEFGFEKIEKLDTMDVFKANFCGGTIYMIVSGIGLTCSTLAASELVHRYQVEHVFSIGSCGAHHKDISIGTIVSPGVVYHGEFDLTVFGRKPFELPSFGQGLALEADPLFPVVACFSFNHFVTDYIEKSEPLCEGNYIAEMELFGIAAACKHFGIGLTAYKIVSDNSDNQAADDFNMNLDAIMSDAVSAIKARIQALMKA